MSRAAHTIPDVAVDRLVDRLSVIEYGDYITETF
jgi:hypothetical protein